MLIHPIKYLFTGQKPTSAMRVSEACERPQTAHTSPLPRGIPDQNISGIATGNYVASVALNRLTLWHFMVFLSLVPRYRGTSFSYENVIMA